MENRFRPNLWGEGPLLCHRAVIVDGLPPLGFAYLEEFSLSFCVAKRQAGPAGSQTHALIIQIAS
jgi:hypothetical protein